jgi:para-aminobenzoate synthetase component 1
MKQRRIPLAKKISYQERNWFKQYKCLSQHEPYHILLESGRGGRWSIIGLGPFAILKEKHGRFTVIERQSRYEWKGNPLDLMNEWMSQFESEKIKELPDFQGGAIGYISYDCARYIERIPTFAKDDLMLPDLYFLVFDDVFIFDHEKQELWIITHYNDEQKAEAEQRLLEYEKQWLQPIEEFVAFDYCSSQDVQHDSVSFSEEEFMDAVEKIRSYISQGDVFQVNLSVRQSKRLKTHPMTVYENLRIINPSPYMAYMHVPEFQIVSGSPELLVKKKGRIVSTRPIAGTRSRGQNDEEDQRLANELIGNEKERAEHVMLVDLERNDLGRVCEYGTVEVNEFMVIEKYSHVMHIVSNVRGTLAEGKDAFDIIKAVFPGGTITGAPKVRTMEIIEELEPVRRGIYTGSIGWISFTGDMELNIVIRTLIAKDGVGYIQAGAGVVIDSNPKHEYKESLKKAKALWAAVEASEAELMKT